MNKTIQITVQIPGDYEWMVAQPWGEIVFFKEKPELSGDQDLLEVGVPPFLANAKR